MTEETDDDIQLSDQEFACLVFRACGASRYIISSLGIDHPHICRLCNGTLAAA
jgi:hypothetical protein